jgi:hypothetical protein
MMLDLRITDIREIIGSAITIGFQSSAEDGII